MLVVIVVLSNVLATSLHNSDTMLSSLEIASCMAASDCISLAASSSV